MNSMNSCETISVVDMFDVELQFRNGEMRTYDYISKELLRERDFYSLRKAGNDQCK